MINKEFEIGEEVQAEGHGDEVFIVSSFMYQESYDNGKILKEFSYLLQSKRKQNKLIDVKPDKMKKLGTNIRKVSKREVDILLDKYIEYMSIQEALEVMAGNGFGICEAEYKGKAQDIIEFLKAVKIT
jgi:hypothetical protein